MKGYKLFVKGTSSGLKLERFEAEELLSKGADARSELWCRGQVDDLQRALLRYRGRVNCHGWLERESIQANATLFKVLDDDILSVDHAGRMLDNKTFDQSKTEHSPSKEHGELASGTGGAVIAQAQAINEQNKDDSEELNEYFRSASLSDNTFVYLRLKRSVLHESDFVEPLRVVNQFWKLSMQGDPEWRARLESRGQELVCVRIRW